MMEASYEILDKIDLTKEKRFKIREKMEHFEAMGLTREEYFFIPSYESIKLKIISTCRHMVRTKKRDLLQNQLKFEEL